MADYASATDGQLHCVHRGSFPCREKMFLARGKTASSWRGARVAMIFQEPMTALESDTSNRSSDDGLIRHHQPISRREARAKADGPAGRGCKSRMPWKLCRLSVRASGGIRQRVMIALAFL